MWIMNQTKDRLIKVEEFVITRITNPKHKFYKGCAIEGNGKPIAVYSTEAKALKVLDEIQIHIAKKENDIYNSKFGVYQMPADDDVIVVERQDNMEVKE